MMKKHIAIAVSVLLFSCSREAEAPEQAIQENEIRTYSLSVTADKGERAEGKALNLDSSGSLEATWAVGEEVSVYKADVLLGTLSAQHAGQSTNLKGEISGEITTGDMLSLKFLSPDYATQDGTLEYIASHCDYATADVTVQSIAGTVVSTDEALFENQQAIIKFCLKDETGTDALSAQSLRVILPSQTITVTPASAAGELYVALPSLSSQALTLNAVVGNKLYLLDKENITLEAGNYYSITAKLSASSTIIVHDEAELATAVQTDGVKILFANDISTTSPLEITDNRTVTIDMGGYTLNRGLSAKDAKGQCCSVKAGATLNLSNGTLTGGWGGDAGGLLNNGTAKLTGVTITDCTSDNKGGGICNYGTLNLDGCTLTGNTAKTDGGGVWNGSTDNAFTVRCCTLTGNTAGSNGGGIYSNHQFRMGGNYTTVKDNTGNGALASNVYLIPNEDNATTIQVTESLFGASIGVSLSYSVGVFTRNYKDFNPWGPENVFFADDIFYKVTWGAYPEAKIEDSDFIYPVTTESQLRRAVTIDNATIKLGADIPLTKLLEITDNKTVTLDLNGFTLDRGCKVRGSQAIVVRTGSTLNLSNGTVTGGWGGNGGALDIENGTTVNLTDVIISGNYADDRGGGICIRKGGTLNMTGGAITGNTSYDHTDPAGGGGLFNYEGATATLTGVTLTGNDATVCGGGGIFNNGTLYLDGVTIQNNTAGSGGGGIYSANEKHLLKMQGANLITDNTAGGLPSNLFMEERRWITLTGSITGSRIGITLDVAPNQFTDGYATYHNGEDPNIFFICDRPETDYLDLIPDEPYVLYVGEVILKKKDLEGKVPYLERSWDSENKKVVFTTKMLTEEIALNATPTSETQYKRLASSPGSYLDLGTENSELHEYYVVSDEEVKFESLIVIGPNVHIILCDNAWLHLNSAVGVERGDPENVNTVYFHAQSSGPSMGKLTSGSIGGSQHSNGANIEIHGGNFDLEGNTGCAAIGGKYDNNGDITIFDGQIKAIGGDDAAGIGGGYMCEDYGRITIYGGTIDATGSAGIGGGNSCINGKLTIWGGNIIARGRSESAGIGSNQYSGDYGAGTITINGGTVRAYGDNYGAGIGGGDGIRGGTLNVNGGHVEAYGGTDAAGIGGGEGGNGGIVNINGGYVFAQGGADYGAGIGGGEDGAGASVTINGGTVVVKAGTLGATGLRGIGPGTGSEDYGSLTFGDDLMVSSWNGSEGPYPAALRRDYCWYRTQARIEPCTHPGYTAETCPYHKH